MFQYQPIDFSQLAETGRRVGENRQDSLLQAYQNLYSQPAWAATVTQGNARPPGIGRFNPMGSMLGNRNQTMASQLQNLGRMFGGR